MMLSGPSVAVVAGSTASAILLGALLLDLAGGFEALPGGG
jgi:hypothetical protein